jgi:hypothetical protein
MQVDAAAAASSLHIPRVNQLAASGSSVSVDVTAAGDTMTSSYTTATNDNRYQTFSQQPTISSNVSFKQSHTNACI